MAKHSVADKVAQRWQKGLDCFRKFWPIANTRKLESVCVAAHVFAQMQGGVQVLPCGYRVFLLAVDAGLTHHSDVFNVFLVDAKVGAPNGDGNSSLERSKARDDLDEEI